MYKNKIAETNKPFIFSKKLKDNRTIPLNNIKNTLGPTRYFPPAIQEWSNSIYTYNNNTYKNISTAHNTITNLIKSYFNFYFSKKLLSSNNLLARFRRLAFSKIFISRAELKHTSNKVIITLYVYNEEKRILIKRLKRIEAILFSYNSSLIRKKSLDLSLQTSLKEKSDLIRKEDTLSLIVFLRNISKEISEQILLEKKALESLNKSNFIKEKLSFIKSLEEKILNIKTIISYCEKDSPLYKRYESIFNKVLNSFYLEKEISLLVYYKLLLNLNKYKFEDVLISKLSFFIRKIYNKEVEFNIINLKAIYLNSDILTQAISLKLRNRNNRLLKVLRYFLSMARLPSILKEKYAHIKIKDLWENKVKNFTLSHLALNSNRDSINDLLIGLFKEDNKYKGRYINIKPGVLNNVLLLLKHKSLAGIRLEAKGRLTRRFTASRSVFKIKWKGTLKNIYSSYRGLSSVILRGHIKSNVQYSIVNSKTRNGSFGLRGWISGK